MMDKIEDQQVRNVWNHACGRLIQLVAELEQAGDDVEAKAAVARKFEIYLGQLSTCFAGSSKRLEALLYRGAEEFGSDDSVTKNQVAVLCAELQAFEEGMQ